MTEYKIDDNGCRRDSNNNYVFTPLEMERWRKREEFRETCIKVLGFPAYPEDFKPIK